MHPRIVDQLAERHIAQLAHLYRQEWWTSDRDVDDARRALADSSIVVVEDPRLDQIVTPLGLKCRVDKVAFYERWGFVVTNDLPVDPRIGIAGAEMHRPG